MTYNHLSWPHPSHDRRHNGRSSTSHTCVSPARCPLATYVAAHAATRARYPRRVLGLDASLRRAPCDCSSAPLCTVCEQDRWLDRGRGRRLSSSIRHTLVGARVLPRALPVLHDHDTIRLRSGPQDSCTRCPARTEAFRVSTVRAPKPCCRGPTTCVSCVGSGNGRPPQPITRRRLVSSPRRGAR